MDHYAPIDTSSILTPLFPGMIKTLAVGCCSHWVLADRIEPSNANHQFYRSVLTLLLVRSDLLHSHTLVIYYQIKNTALILVLMKVWYDMFSHPVTASTLKYKSQ